MTTEATHTGPLYPNVKVRLCGEDGNAFAILGRCHLAARRAGLTADQIAEYRREATSADYANLLATTLRFFDCE